MIAPAMNILYRRFCACRIPRARVEVFQSSHMVITVYHAKQRKLLDTGSMKVSDFFPEKLTGDAMHTGLFLKANPILKVG